LTRIVFAEEERAVTLPEVPEVIPQPVARRRIAVNDVETRERREAPGRSDRTCTDPPGGGAKIQAGELGRVVRTGYLVGGLYIKAFFVKRWLGHLPLLWSRFGFEGNW
jgi:hypothetical protein